MKRFLCLSVFVAVTLTGNATFAADECIKIIATGHPQYPAIAYRDGDNIVGAAPTLVEAIAKELNIPLESKYMGSWEDAQAAARDGKADMIFGIYYNDERATYLDYVQPAFTYDDVAVFVVKGKEFDFKGQDDLIGKKGVTNQGESYGTDFDAFMKDKLNVARTAGIDAAFQDLLAGKADYLIAGYYPGLAEAAKEGIKDKVVALNQALLTAEMFVAFSKKSPCRSLADKFGQQITVMTTNDGFDKMLVSAEADWESAQQPKK
ncbi:MAG TPA: transporter substrate-binding domain-containing protein [Methyloceanibacter sp.]|jgi:polar amino acid transport system substrate-binding protein|nr:transporter substrate-binding domain-containing protein [Methyloceanibacter sp.]